MTPTKEELVELIGMADILESKLIYMGLDDCAGDEHCISLALRTEIDKICGEEYLESLRTHNNGNKLILSAKAKPLSRRSKQIEED